MIKKFEQVCSSARMNASSAINMFNKTVLREQKIPFEVESNTLDDIICEKIKEAELEMDNTSTRYTINDTRK
jgi:addiction module RelB/DinJ family antitoxin